MRLFERLAADGKAGDRPMNNVRTTTVNDSDEFVFDTSFGPRETKWINKRASCLDIAGTEVDREGSRLR